MDAKTLSDRFNPKVANALKEATAGGGFPVLLGITVTRCEPGLTECSLPLTEKLANGVGTVHGGAISSLIDHTLSLTIYPLVEVGRWVATLEFKVNYMSWAREGTLRAVGRVESLRNHVAVVRVDVHNGDDVIAQAQGTLYIRDKVA